jgi:hypothetical protein
MRRKTLKVFVCIPDNDREKKVSRITVRTTFAPIGSKFLVGGERDCGVITADLSLKAAREIAKWAAQFDTE